MPHLTDVPPAAQRPHGGTITPSSGLRERPCTDIRLMRWRAPASPALLSNLCPGARDSPDLAGLSGPGTLPPTQGGSRVCASHTLTASPCRPDKLLPLLRSLLRTSGGAGRSSLDTELFPAAFVACLFRERAALRSIEDLATPYMAYIRPCAGCGARRQRVLHRTPVQARYSCLFAAIAHAVLARAHRFNQAGSASGAAP